MKIDERGTLYHDSIGERGEIAFEKTNEHGLIMLGSQIITQIFSLALKIVPAEYKTPVRNFVKTILTTISLKLQIVKRLLLSIKSTPTIGSILIFIQQLKIKQSFIKSIQKVFTSIINIIPYKLVGKILLFIKQISVIPSILRNITKHFYCGVTTYFNIIKSEFIHLIMNIHIKQDLLRNILKSFVKSISVSTIFSKLRWYRHTANETIINTVLYNTIIKQIKKYTKIKVGD